MTVRALFLVIATAWVMVVAATGFGLFGAYTTVTGAIAKGLAATQVGRAVFELNILSHDYLLRPQSRSRRQWQLKSASLKRLLVETRALFGKQTREIVILESGHRQISDAFERLVAIHAAAEGPGSDQGLSDEAKQGLGFQLIVVSQTMFASAYRLVLASEYAVQRAAERMAVIIAVLFGSVVAVLVISGSMLTVRVFRPIRRLRDDVDMLQSGDTGHRISVTGADEIGQLGRAFDAMVRSLEEAKQGLELRVAARTVDLSAANAELEAANRELEAFSYSVSHDLRGPLRAMDGFSKAVLEDYADKLDADGVDYLHRIRASSQRMARLIDELLELSRVTRTALKRVDVDLSGLAEDIRTELQGTDPDRRVSFDIASGVTARGDQEMIRIALENLLGNAWKFTARREAAVIEFGTTDGTGRPVYFVRDNGAGFDMAYADNLFQPFQRLHGSDEFAGTGIGLATVQRIVHRHGGDIRAESVVDQGTTVYFTL